MTRAVCGCGVMAATGSWDWAQDTTTANHSWYATQCHIVTCLPYHAPSEDLVGDQCDARPVPVCLPANSALEFHAVALDRGLLHVQPLCYLVFLVLLFLLLPLLHSCGVCTTCSSCAWASVTLCL